MANVELARYDHVESGLGGDIYLGGTVLDSISEESLDWNAIKSVLRWTPLDELGATPEKLADRPFNLNDHAYIVAVNQNQRFEMDKGPYRTMTMWADSEGAARRSLLYEIEADGDKTPSTAPTEMSSLEWPSGWEFIKGVFGQRIYMP